jgi:uncharacterized membrane protein (DUF485 family)
MQASLDPADALLRPAAPPIAKPRPPRAAGADPLADVARIAAHPLFRRLVAERQALGGTLAVLMASVYFSFILTVAFRPALLGAPVWPDAVTTWGVVLGAGLLSFGFALTAIYVLVANTRLDRLTRLLREELE